MPKLVVIHDNLPLMTNNAEVAPQFTGLILLTGADKAGISEALFRTLAPFAISIVDIEQLVIADRLVLTVLISLNPSHQKAIEADLDECAASNEVDIATLFTNRPMPESQKMTIWISISSNKLHPKTISLVSKAFVDLGANIESIVRTNTTPLVLDLALSGISMDIAKASLAKLSIEDGTAIEVRDIR